MNRVVLAIVIVIAAVGTYVILHDIGSHRIAVKIEAGALRNLHKTWVELGKPKQFDPSSYITSS
jgi:hypothetical protein